VSIARLRLDPQRAANKELPTMNDPTQTTRRWATRKATMTYACIGSTGMNELLQAKAFVAKKRGAKVVIDLDSVDRYYDALPDVSRRS
jgi:hypothetical protein